jgi:hypothetical protein
MQNTVHYDDGISIQFLTTELRMSATDDLQDQ